MGTREDTIEELRQALADKDALLRRSELRLAETRIELGQARDTQAQFGRVFEQAPALIAVLSGPNHVFSFHNHQYRALFPGRHLAGKPVREALPELAGQGIYEMLDQVYSSGEAVLGDEIPLTLDRAGNGHPTEHFFNFVYHPARDDHGKVEGILVHAVEVTAQVAAKRLLATEHQRIEAEVARRTRELDRQKRFAESIIQNVPSGIAYVDADLIYRVSNPVYSAFLQLAPEAIVGRYLFDVVPGGEEQILPLLQGVLQTGIAHHENEFRFNYNGPDGQPRETYWDFLYYPAVLEEGGKAAGVLVLANEISDRVLSDRGQRRVLDERDALQRERVEQLVQTDRMKDQFLGILSHELRTPLNAIQGFGSILEDGVAGILTDDQHKYVSKILDGADLMLGLVNDLLDMSRVQAGKFSLDLQPVDLPPLIRETLATLHASSADKGHTLVDEGEASLPGILADPRRVSQILSNLITNAIKYTPKGGRIGVRASVDGGALRVEVSDTGLGIAPDQQTRIFQAFTQVDMSLTRSRGGVGLGLSIVKGLVEAHGGTLGVESPGPGQGSTFWFTLPLPSAGSPHS